MQKNIYQILIVGDNEADRRLLKEILNGMDRLATTDVASVDAALEEITQKAPDLILLDINAPEKNGVEFLKKLYQLGHQDIPVIFISSFGFISSLGFTLDKYDGIKLWASDFIDKPIVAEDLKLKVAVHLKIKKLVEDMKWASQKTNECIKMLYKELNKKNEELKQLDQIKDEFVNNVSHELRTPLIIIRENIQQVADGLHGATTEKQQKCLTRSLTTLDHLNGIIDNLLDISKLEDGKLEIIKESVDIIALAKEVSENFSTQVESRGLQLRYRFPQEQIKIFVDREKIIQVFTNLINNALKFTEKGFIEISVEDLEKKLECCIRDTGKGIAPKDLPKMFNKFEQVGRTHGPGQKGTGLGLSICKGIIELHNGHIRVESEINKGTAFTFVLPKQTAKEFFSENIKKALSSALKNKASFSILLLTAENIKDLERSINPYLQNKGDRIIPDSERLYIILPEASKENAQTVAKRIKEVIDDNIEKKLKNLGKYSLKIYNYPEDGRTEQELVGKIEQESLK